MKISGSFKGGIHPSEHKHQTEHKPIERLPLPSRVVIPLQQHIGAPCDPLVQVGDEVLEGQKIGESKGFVSATVHASISGKVTAIEEVPHPTLPKPARAVVIENTTPTPAAWDAVIDWSTFSSQELLTRIKEAGLVGMGGAAFPSHVKLSPPKQNPVDTLIINGVECEPFLTADHRLMLERPAELLEGVKILMKVLGVKRAYIGIEKNNLTPFSFYRRVRPRCNGRARRLKWRR
jgi:Na+-translocating ferredoxin:NAD+ oxidoreductase subunit C